MDHLPEIGLIVVLAGIAIYLLRPHRFRIAVPPNPAKQWRLRWGMKVAGTFYPKGTEVMPLLPEDPMIRRTWGIGRNDFPKRKEGSKSVAIRLPGVHFATIVSVSEIEYVQRPDASE